MTILDQNMYLGRPGALEQIYFPKAQVDRTRVRQVDVFGLGNGGYRVGKQLGGARRYQLNYIRLDYATFKTLEAYDQGHNGPGPFVFLDPAQRNLLTVNQSSATSERNNTDNFTISGSGLSMASSTAQVLRGPRSLAVTYQFGGVSTGVLSLNSPALEWAGFPVVVGRSMVLSAWVRGGGTDGIVSITPALQWYDAANAFLSTSTSGSPTATAPGSWAQAVFAATPPAGAAFCLPIFTAASSVNAGDITYYDQLMLHEGTAVDSVWSPGVGILPVSIVSLQDSFPVTAPTYREKPTLILQEVGNSG